MKTLPLFIALALLALPSGALAALKKDPTKITCEEFAASTPESQSRVAAYLDGYSKGGKKLEELGELEVDRELDVLVVSCTQAPKLTLWQKLEMKIPGGKKRVKIPMTCEEFLSLSSDVQPEAAYFLAGYDRASKTAVAAAGEIDLERDVAVLVEECKPAPKESLWARIKKHF
jgi:hypothetical protein